MYFPFLYFILPSNSKMICNSSFGRAFILISFRNTTLYLGAFWFWELSVLVLGAFAKSAALTYPPHRIPYQSASPHHRPPLRVRQVLVRSR